MITVRYVNNDDKDFWYSLDQHLPEKEFDKKVRDRQGYVLFEDGIPKGLLRYKICFGTIRPSAPCFLWIGQSRKGAMDVS